MSSFRIILDGSHGHLQGPELFLQLLLLLRQAGNLRSLLPKF
ncbi:hypothetical protein A2U01_0092514, partial [Trifolium medium]|nr:hypothetical protein [Trifolium medium]